MRPIFHIAHDAILAHDRERRYYSSRYDLECTAVDLAVRIAAGTDWLDRVDKDQEHTKPWFEKIDPEHLNLGDCESCVMGCVVGDYRAAITIDGKPYASEYPFAADEIERNVERTLGGVSATPWAISHVAAGALGFHLDDEEREGMYYDRITAGWRAVVEELQHQAGIRSRYPSPTVPTDPDGDPSYFDREDDDIFEDVRYEGAEPAEFDG